MTELVSFVEDELPPDVLWRPAGGPSLEAFLERARVSPGERTQLRERAVAVLGACLPPYAVGAKVRTGLVVGHVQSGKTQSFTALTALARDAGYPLVVLLAGTKKNLFGQTVERLRTDLQGPGTERDWLIVDNPSPQHAKFGQVERQLKEQARVAVASGRLSPRTVVFTVMKNRAQLARLTRTLQMLESEGALLSETPVLMIDDEADQAGLNAKPRKKATATYAAILEARQAAGAHSYVMYTATPQAPLLLALSDELSPDFVRVLTPGTKYTGGEHFFGEARNDFVRPISPTEASAVGQLPLDALPALESAIAVFLLGVAAEGTRATRSMLVHPSPSTDAHAAMHRWIQGRVQGIASSIHAGGTERRDVVEHYFRPAYVDLATTVQDLPPLDDLIDDVAAILSDTDIRTINSSEGSEEGIEWGSAAAWILVGGYKLDRGFTIVGLTVTYMPRSIGVGNADSIQQRARFFGYKAEYAEYCRGWFEERLERAYVAYVEHERHLLGELRTVERSGQGLRDWKRRMLLEPTLRPCRASVVSLPHVRSALRDETWLQLGGVRADDFEHNWGVVSTLPWRESVRHSGDTRPDVDDSCAHQVLRVSGPDALKYVLGEWRAHGIDAARLYQVAIVLANLVDADEEPVVELVRMDAGEVRNRALTSAGDRIENLHVGRSRGYAGDREVADKNALTIQFHKVAASSGSRATYAACALWVPKQFAGGVLYEVD